MVIGERPSIISKRMLFGVISLALLCAAIAGGFVDSITHHIAGSADAPVRSERAARKGERAGVRDADRMSALPGPLPEIPQAGTQFDLSRHVIAGGGGTSAGANLGLSGTNGQAAAGKTSSGGQFTVTGGCVYEPPVVPSQQAASISGFIPTCCGV